MNIKSYSLSVVIMILCYLIRVNSIVYGNPSPCVITGPISVCENSTAAYNISISGNNTYYWNATGGGTVIGSGASISVSWTTAGSGVVSVIVKDSLLNIVCTAVLHVTIHSNPQPVITASFISGCGGSGTSSNPNGQKGGSSCLSACDSTWVTYFTPLHAGSTYTWTLTGAANYNAVGNQLHVFWTATGGGTVSVKETDANGCTGETEVCITIVGKPIAAFKTLPGLTGLVVDACKGQVIQFIDQSTASAGSPISTWSWYFGDGNSAFYTAPGSANTSHGYANAGTYIVMLVVENQCGCKDTAKVTVVVSNSVGPDIFCISTVCPGTTVTYHTNAHCGNYTWGVTNGTAIGLLTDSTFTVQWGSTGPGIISLSVNCAGFCPATTSVLIPIIPPNATINGPSSVCQGNCYTYGITCDIPVDSIHWHFPPGVNVTSDSINIHEVNVCFYNSNISGNISVDYFHKIPGSTPELSCGGHSVIHVAELPQMYLSGATTACQNQPFTYNVFPSPTGTIYWSITDVTGVTTYTSNTITGSIPFTGIWSYGQGIFLVVAKDLSGNYCNSPQQLTVTVNPLLPPLDSIVGPNPVCPNQSYTYKALPTSSLYFTGWQVTNGVPANAAGSPISVNWGLTGPYKLDAIQVDPVTGCKSTAISKTINSLLPLIPATIIGPTTVCANGDVNYSTTALGDDYEWSINSGIAGSVKSGQHTKNVLIEWNNYTGTAWLVLTRTACSSSIKDSVLITINHPTVPIITAPTSICQGISGSFSSSGAVSYLWNFGDGNTGSGSPVSHIYNSPGSFIITLTVTYSGFCSGSAVNTANITVNPKPNINISTPDPSQFCNAPILTDMFISANVIGTTYQWYNSGLIAGATNTSYTASSAGSYFVVGTNSYGCSDTSNIISVSLINCNSNCSPAPYTLTFNKTRLGCNTDSDLAVMSAGIIDPTWNFNDIFNPSTENGDSATHTFTEPGYYRVTLCAEVPNTAGTGYCNECVTINDTINYVSDFYISQNCSTFSDSLNVQFVNTTKILLAAPVPTWLWTVTPGSYSSTSQNPSWKFAAGTYTAVLTVGGICSIIKTFIVLPFPNASFNVADSFCVNKPVIFLNTSSGGNLSSSWTFGDSSSSLITSPIRNYSNPGIYLVTLQIVNNLGCLDTATKNVTVLPNTLAGIISPSGPTTFCEGDSVNLICNAAGGYPAFQYLWTTTQTSQSIYASMTGSYGVQVTDSKRCYLNVNPINIIVNNKPMPVITGPTSLCQNTLYTYSVNYPSIAGAILNWFFDGNFQTTGSSYSVYSGSLTLGAHQIVINIISPDSCSGTDTLNVILHPNPNVSIITNGALCEGSNNMLIGFTISPNIESLYWSSGQTSDTIYSSVSGNYTVNVVDSNGCSANATAVVNPLPDLCGLMTGCYEICATIKQLVWSASQGYASYQWYYNSVLIAGSTADTIHIPLYKSGAYTVMVTSAAGCSIMSDPINITFIKCGGCQMNAKDSIVCGPFDDAGYPTFYLTFIINNSLGTNAGITITSSQGIISGLNPITLAPGIDTINAIFTETPPINNFACFTIIISNESQRCDTTICNQLPECNGECKDQISVEKLNCAGFDGNGNPQYYLCLDVNWGGSNGSLLTLSTASGNFSVNPVTINNGNQTICYTFTDLPPHSGLLDIYAYFYDPVTGKVCRDSLKYEFVPCVDSCNLVTYNECIDCGKLVGGEWTYNIDLTVLNPFGTDANIFILPNSYGTYSSFNPDTVPPGLQSEVSVFTDLSAPSDSIICFTVVLVNPLTNEDCYKNICLVLPKCSNMGVLSYNNANSFTNSCYPNPFNKKTIISFDLPEPDFVNLKIFDIFGNGVKTLLNNNLEKGNTNVEFDASDLTAGIYFYKIEAGNKIAIGKMILMK